RLRLIDRLPIDRVVGGEPDPPVVPRGFRIPLFDEVDPVRVVRDRGFEREPGRSPDLLAQRGRHPVGDVDLPSLERGEARGRVRNRPEDDALDLGRFPPVWLDRLRDQLHAWRERDEAVWARPDRKLLEPFVADLLYVFLGHDPAGARRARVEREEVGPRLLEPEADACRIWDLDRRDPLLEGLARGATVALERELDVLGRHRVTVVEFDAPAQDELLGEAVGGDGP